MGPDSKTFSNVTPESINVLKQQLGSNAIPKPDGTIEIMEHGFHATAFYNSVTRELMVTLIKKPFMVPANMVWSRLNDALYGKGKQA